MAFYKINTNKTYFLSYTGTHYFKRINYRIFTSFIQNHPVHHSVIWQQICSFWKICVNTWFLERLCRTHNISLPLFYMNKVKIFLCFQYKYKFVVAKLSQHIEMLADVLIHYQKMLQQDFIPRFKCYVGEDKWYCLILFWNIIMWMSPSIKVGKMPCVCKTHHFMLKWIQNLQRNHHLKAEWFGGKINRYSDI